MGSTLGRRFRACAQLHAADRCRTRGGGLHHGDRRGALILERLDERGPVRGRVSVRRPGSYVPRLDVGGSRQVSAGRTQRCGTRGIRRVAGCASVAQPWWEHAKIPSGSTASRCC